jgi:phage terminase small subunit
MMANEVAMIERIELGPAVLELQDRHRAFVLAYFQVDMGPRRAGRAAIAAGYDPKNADQTAWHLLRHPKVRDALIEMTAHLTRTLGPEAFAVLKDILQNGTNVEKLSAIKVVYERVDPAVTKQDINVKHETVDHRQTMIDYLRELKRLGVSRDKLIEEFGFSGLSIWEERLAREDAAKPKVIDATYEEVRGPAETIEMPEPLAKETGKVTDENPEGEGW